VSGPVTTEDVPVDPGCGEPDAPEVELLPGREADVGGMAVRRLLPRRQRRTVGAWCFADHFGPTAPPASMQVGPHPHTGLATVTWLVEGEVVHRDSLGSTQLIRPGQLNLMTAGHGVSHAEEQTSGRIHGAQLWVAQPDATRNGDPAFEHHGELPTLTLGSAVATVLVGEVAGARSPARADTPLLGLDLVSSSGTGGTAGTAEVPLNLAFEHALVVLDGTVTVDGVMVAPGVLAYLGSGRDDVVLAMAGGARALLLGGEPFAEQIVMGWNFVGRSREDVAQAGEDWNAGHERFGTVASALARIPAP
jgi:redox-sensitive bicupin YhaK (pirin superfamily)